MDIAITDRGSTATVRLVGRLDIAGAEILGQPLATLSGSKNAIVLDMAEVTFVASIGLRHLVSASKAVRRRGGGLTLLNPSDAVTEVITASGLTELLPIERNTPSEWSRRVVLAMIEFETCLLARAEAMSDLTEKVMTFWASTDGSRANHHVALVFEEVLGNLTTHGNCRDIPAKIAVRVSSDEALGEVVDDGPPFDPRLAPQPSFDVPADDRSIGGLGLHLVRQLSSDLQNARHNNQNFMTFAVNGTWVRLTFS